MPSVGHAVLTCTATVNAKTGNIEVGATGVSGPLLWGDRAGSEPNAFANAATCIVSGKAKKCLLAAAGTPQAIIPPDLCFIYVKDAGAECAAHIKYCTPGPRPTSVTKADALKELVNAVEFHHSVPTVVFKGVNVQIVSDSGQTNGPVNGAGNLIIGYNEASACASSYWLNCASDADCPLDTCIGGLCNFADADCSTDADCPANVCGAHSLARTGSHNLVIGDFNSYSSYGGLVAGTRNTISGPGGSVSGGSDNTASGGYASVSGGSSNMAAGEAASVTGGYSNLAADLGATVSGGASNYAAGSYSAVCGGLVNRVFGSFSTVGGGSGVLVTAQHEWHASKASGFPSGSEY
jgi:hypothetical protein